MPSCSDRSTEAKSAELFRVAMAVHMAETSMFHPNKSKRNKKSCIDPVKIKVSTLLRDIRKVRQNRAIMYKQCMLWKLKGVFQNFVLPKIRRPGNYKSSNDVRTVDIFFSPISASCKTKIKVWASKITRGVATE